MYKKIFSLFISVLLIFSFPCVAYAEIDFADNVLTSGIEIQVKANVDPNIQGDILVWVSSLDEPFDTYTTLYEHNNYTQTIYVKNPGNYRISSVSYNGMFSSDYQVEYKEIEVVSGLTNHLIFSIGEPTTNSTIETTNETENTDDIITTEIDLENEFNDDADIEVFEENELETENENTSSLEVKPAYIIAGVVSIAILVGGVFLILKIWKS